MKSGRVRRALLDAGREIFSEKGYQASTVESIADRAAVTPVDFHAHFRDVEDLFIEVVGELTRDLYGEAFQHGPSPTGEYDERRTLLGLRRVIDRLIEHRGLWRAVLEGSLASPAVERAWFHGRSFARDELVSRTVRMQDAGLMRRMDPEVCVDGLIGMVEWYVMSRAAFPSAGPLAADDDTASGLIDLWLHAVGLGPSA